MCCEVKLHSDSSALPLCYPFHLGVGGGSSHAPLRRKVITYNNSRGVIPSERPWLFPQRLHKLSVLSRSFFSVGFGLPTRGKGITLTYCRGLC